MDLKNELKQTVSFSTQKKVSPKLIFLLGVFGLAVLVLAGWIYFADWRARAYSESASQAGNRIIEELVEPIRSLKRVMSDEQVKSLAMRALDDPEKSKDLFSYLNGRMSQISGVQLFSSDTAGLRATDLGPNGYALLEMILEALEGNESLLQIHHVLQPAQMFDAMAIESDGQALGALVVSLDPEYLLAGFNPDYGSLGVVRLTQYNGRQPASILAEFGDASLLGDVPERIPVRGTLFRLEYPSAQAVQLIGPLTLLLMLLVGIASVAASMVLFRSNKNWILQGKLEAARKERAEAEAIRPPAPRRRLESDARPASQAVEPVAEPEAADVIEADSVEAAGGDDSDAQFDDTEPPPMHLHYDIAERRRMRESRHQPVELTPGIFRAYDIRGVIDKTLDSGVARSVGQAVGTLALERDAAPVVVARDGRLSGPYLMEGMIEGIRAAGCDVLDIGAVPTGVLYFAAHEMAAGSGVMITGSHNPPDYNGFKIMVGGDTLHGDAISDLYHRITRQELSFGEGQLNSRDVIPDYIEKIASDIKIEKPMRVVIDCGNGIGGVCAADTLRAIGVEVLPLFDEVDGTFPNHHPDPSEPENLNDLIESVRLMDADLGLALDGDADRLGVVTLAGNIIYPDRIMMLLAMDVLDRNPGATIIYDVKCTGHLPEVIRQAGGNPMMYKTGHSLIKSKMKEIGSPFAGEMSGHFFFGERWYGVDDGIYAAARLLEILGDTEAPPEAILNALPTSYSTPELKVQMQEGENHAFIDAFRAAAKFDDAEVSTIDGLRADFADGWGLVRASNTTPILVVRFDAETEEALERIKSVFRTQMLAIRSDLDLPF